MTQDKTPEGIISKIQQILFERYMIEEFDEDYGLQEMIEEYADQEKRKAFNEALELAAEKAQLKLVDTKMNNSYVDMFYVVDKQSILNLKIK